MKAIAGVLFLIFCLAWAVYFWTHMSTVCSWPIMVGTKECIGYNIGRIAR